MARITSKQWMVAGPLGVLALLSLAAGSYVMGICLVAATGSAFWLLRPRGKPENIAIKSLTCPKCGAPAEPHWSKCLKCGEGLKG